MLKYSLTSLSLLLIVITTFYISAHAQGGQTLFGDVRITGENNELVSKDVTLILRKVPDGEVGRQTVSSRGRYRFTNLKVGEYEIVIEADGREIGRLQQVIIRSQLSNSPYGHQYDLEFRWRPNATVQPAGGVISAAEIYERPASNRALFHRAEEAVAKKKLDDAADLLKQLLATDDKDFQAWTALGSIYFAQEKVGDAQTAYLKAIEVHPTSARAQLNLGRLLSSQKKFEEAVEPLTKSIDLEPTGDANYLLGECYLQLKKGSKAVPYLNEAAKLGRSDAHLRLGWLYNAAGMKDKAAIEYEEYLKKNPDYPDRHKLKEYIIANKKS